MADFRQSEETANFGGAGYSGMGGGGSQWLWWVLIVLFIFIFLFRGREGEHGGNCGCNPTVSGCRSVFVDESNYEEEKHLQNKIDIQAEKTRGLIEANYKEQANREFHKELAEKAELKNKIYMLENEKYTDAKFDKLTALVQHDYNTLYREIDRLPKPSPCYAPTCTTPVCSPCMINACELNAPRRCDC